jgi:hypothetical protein
VPAYRTDTHSSRTLRPADFDVAAAVATVATPSWVD